MHIRRVDVRNFRGIREGCLEFCGGSRMACLIGAGDSTKTTLLNAIEWALWPSYSLGVSDTDFTGSDTSDPIEISVTFDEYPAELEDDRAFGMYIRGSVTDGGDDDPRDGGDRLLTVRLSVGDSLEPEWCVIKNSKEPKKITAKQRALFGVHSLGGDCAKDLSWGRQSVLHRYAKSKGATEDARVQALRKLEGIDAFGDLDKANETIAAAAGKTGVKLDKDAMGNQIVVNPYSVSGSIALMEGGVPLRQRGLGSQRLISMGLGIGAVDDGAILLVDEVETGLEPYRLRSLVSTARELVEKAGQCIFTTHSPVALTELDAEELYAVSSSGGETSVFPFSKAEDAKGDVQRLLRGNSEAFLARGIVVCEGKTEVGFLKAVDENLKGGRMALAGSFYADAGSGGQTFPLARLFRSAGYDACIFMDSDSDDDNGKKPGIRGEGVEVFDWEDGNCLEKQVFVDVPHDIVRNLISLAVELNSESHVRRGLDANSLVYDALVSSATFDAETREKLGEAAVYRKAGGSRDKDYSWFKNIEKGKRLGEEVLGCRDELAGKKLLGTIESLESWVSGEGKEGSDGGL